MWYLVIPPIIVVISLSFLLWYLSRKGADPVIAEKISQQEDEKPSFSRTKEFSLRILEKWAQRFKVASLRAHNSLSEFTQSVKESRRKIQENILPVEESPVEEVTPEKDKGSFFSRFSGVGTRKEEMKQTETLSDEKSITFEEEAIPRPMVSETVAEPEVRRKRMKPNISREESLIGRIAVNPKDFTAYEELGDYYLEIENIKDAKECYRQVLKLSPVHRLVKIKIRRLEKLLTRDGE